jgi:hypothetical protein
MSRHMQARQVLGIGEQNRSLQKDSGVDQTICHGPEFSNRPVLAAGASRSGHEKTALLRRL